MRRSIQGLRSFATPPSPRRHCLVAASLLIFAIAGPAAAERPNVLFLTVDDMNWDSVGAFGCRVPGVTPHIDRLASEGLRFEHGHVTIAICQPTRAVWMTGRYPHRSGALGFDPIDAGVPTLLETLHDAGYLTGILAKVPHVLPSRRTAWDVIVEAKELKNGRDPGGYHDASAAFFEKSKTSGRPFFLMANAQDPHRPFARSPQEAQRSERPTKSKKPSAKKPGKKDGAAKQESPSGSQAQSGRQARADKKRPLAKAPAPISRVYRADEVTVPDFLPDIPDVRQEIAEYFTSAHRADETVGAVLRALDESGLRDNTLVMFVSDHGMPLPFAKTNCWRNSTRTPWIVRWPGVVKPGSHDQAHLVSGIDFAPTILEAVGLPPIEGVDGRSFLPLLGGAPQEGRDHVFTHINRTAGRREYPMRSVQTRRFGYIWNGWANGETVFKNESQAGRTMKAMVTAAKTDDEVAARVKHFLYRTPEEFYDYEHDPHALHNLIDAAEQQERIARFRKMLLEHMRATGDPQRASYRPVAEAKSARIP